jgi:hypothetical protein
MIDEHAREAEGKLGRRAVLVRVLAGLAVSGIVSARRALAGPVMTDRYGDKVQAAPRGELPDFVREEPDAARLYRFATDHAADLEYIPCFCGCKNIGHRSNRDCYIKSFNRDGTVTYTSHGAT